MPKEMKEKISDILIEFTDKLGWNTKELHQDSEAYNECEKRLEELFFQQNQDLLKKIEGFEKKLKESEGYFVRHSYFREILEALEDIKNKIKQKYGKRL